MKIKKIDIHAHVKPSFINSQGSTLDETELIKMYNELSIEKGVILPFMPDGSTNGSLSKENAKLISEKYPDTFYWFTTVDLTAFDFKKESLYDFLSGQKKLGAKGVGEIVSNIYFDNEKIDELFSACQKLCLPVLFHLTYNLGKGYGVVDSPSLLRLDYMLSKYPDLKFIGHSDGFWNEFYKQYEDTDRITVLMRKHKNLCCDLSAGSGMNAMMCDINHTLSFMEEFQGRILYGCDITTPANTHQYKMAEFFDGLYDSGKISETVYRKIARENAINLLKI